MKYCIRCNSNKSKDEFPIKKQSKDGLLSWCKECSSAYNRQYREANKDKVKEMAKYHREKNKEEMKEYNKKYYKENKEKILENVSKYNINNKEKISIYNRKWNQENIKEKKRYNQQYYIDNKEKIKQNVKQYRRNNNNRLLQIRSMKNNKMIKKLPYTLTLKEWEIIKEEFDFSCCYCGITEEEHYKKHQQQLSQDHFIPFSKGGGYTKDNIVPACASCNSKKHNINFFTWYPTMPFYSEEKERFILKYLNYDGQIHLYGYL